MWRFKLQVWAIACAASFSFLWAGNVAACGASTGGVGVSVCSVEEMREASRHKWHVGAGYSWSDTQLNFTGDSLDGKTVAVQKRHVATAVLEWRATPRWSFQVGAGALLGGELLFEGERSTMQPGFAASLGASFVALRAKGKRPFLLFDARLSSVFSGTEPDVSYSAYDLRLGAALGYTFFKSLSPYLVTRAFGGPAFWSVNGESIQGTDKYHYQLGGGISFQLRHRFDLFVEGIPLGERGVSAGIGLSF